MAKSKTKNKKIVVGMSGGIDSTISLLLLKKQGWQPIGVSLKLPIWKNKENFLRENVCCTRESTEAARGICRKLNIPFYIFNVRADFKKEVIKYFISEFKKNKTPNPCVICNRHLKFKKLFEFAKKHSINFVATGHYAKIKFNSQTKKYELLKAKDEKKDQTYSLSFLPRRWLKNIIFPLGDYLKEEVYQIAVKEGLDFFLKKKQSQDFCFVAGKSLPCFLKEKIGEKPGVIANTKGEKLGSHRGLHFYTIGQRKGLPLNNGPYFVKEFNVSKNILVVTKNQQEISRQEIILSPYHFISGEPPKTKTEVSAKVRYQQNPGKAIIYPPTKGKLKIIFAQPQSAVTPGQFCVFYRKNVCLGAGIINCE